MTKQIIDDWKLGNKFREILVFTFNYNEESLTRYGKEPNGDGRSRIYKQVANIVYGKSETYKKVEA